MNNPKVSIIFVNYKTPQMTADAIASVKEKTKGINYEIIVTDNSNDLEEYNELVKCINDNNVLVIDAKANLGFGKANNLAAKYAKGDYLFFLNTDTLLINDAISILANYLDNNINVGICGPNIYTRDLNPWHSYVKKEHNLKLLKSQENIFNYFRQILFKKRKDFNYKDKVLKVNGYICGAALMIRKDIFNQLNGFDKDIFMYAEEALLCHQTHKLGYELYNIPEAKIIHFEGGSFKQIREATASHCINGNYIYYKKAYSLDEANKYLKVYYKIAKRKLRLFKIIKDQKRITYYETLKKVIINKAEEVGIKL